MVMKQEVQHALGRLMRGDAAAFDMHSLPGRKGDVKGSPHGAARKFAWIIEDSGDGSFLVSDFCRRLDVVEDTVLDFADGICRVCWAVCYDIFSSQGPLAAARTEVERLKSRVVECNLGAVRQVSALKSSLYSKSDLDEDAVTFHEPLQFVDEASRELVLRIVADKLRQLQSGTAPQSLIDALLANCSSGENSHTKLLAEVEELKREVDRHSATSDQVRELEDSHTRLVAELEESKHEVGRQKAQVERLADLEPRIEQIDTASQGTQTTLASRVIDDLTQEVRRLKLVLAELQAKLSDLLGVCSQQGFQDEFAEIAKRMGVDSLRGKSVFDRLYADALDRIGRLESLRARALNEREKFGLPDNTPAEASVIESVLASADDYRSERVFVSCVRPAAPADLDRAVRCVGGTEWKLPAEGRPGPGEPYLDAIQARSPSHADPPSPVGPSSKRRARLAPRTSQSLPSLPLAGAPHSRRENLLAQAKGHARERRPRGWG